VDTGTAILFSTHTPFTIREFLEDSEKGTFILKKDSSGKHFIQNTKLPGQKLFDRSPTYGEIMWKAFDMPTTEFHTDLYNELHELYNELYYTSKKHNKKSDLKEFDQQFFVSKYNIAKDSPWMKNPKKASIHTHLRNKIHHPKENNGLPDEPALTQSIEKMIELLNFERPV
jgi:hypothetical protein